MEINRKICPSGLKNNPNKALTAIKYITIHCTGNYGASATALSHANYLYNGSAGAQASWHYTVDKKEVWQSFEDTQACWHAADGSNGPGNSTSIAIEICVNDKDGFLAACDLAAQLTTTLLTRHGLTIGDIKQHNAWSGKDCPKELRSGAWGVTWEGFLATVKKYFDSTAVTDSQGMPTLRRGDKNSIVKTMQEWLSAYLVSEGLQAIDADGSFGPATEAAVKLFQSLQGLQTDGICGPATWSALIATRQSTSELPDAEKSAVELTVSHLVSDGIIVDPAHWLGYLNGNSATMKEYVKMVFDRYHDKLMQCTADNVTAS